MTFEWMVLDHESRYRRTLGRRRRETVGDSRKRKFLKTSRAWLSESVAPPLAEICEVACWVYEECDGRFPFEAINPWSGKADEKLTSIVQLRWHFECLRSAMAMRDTDPARYTSTSPRVSVNAPPRDVQAEVDGLVEQFVKFRGRIASDSLRRNCADTFRIMLTRDKIGLEDIETVLANLAWVGTQVGIDLRLYQDTAFPLRRDFKRIHQKVVDALGERSASGAADRGDNA